MQGTDDQNSDVTESSLPIFFSHATWRAAVVSATALLGITLCVHAAAAVTAAVTLADQPVFATNTVPGNMAFTLSVEYPTAISVANLYDYAPASTYLGYFDPAKCYNYIYNGGATPTTSDNSYSYAVAENSYFKPAAFATGSYGHSCSGMWSGNFMNWVAMQTIDPFRWALTGGYRATDQTSYPQTVLEKAWGSKQGGTNNYPYRGTDQTVNNSTTPGNNLNSSLIPISSVTPLSTWTNFNSGVWANGNTMLISGVPKSGSNYGGFEVSTFATNVFDLPGDVNSSAPTPGYIPSGTTSASAVPNAASNIVTYRVYIRVSVCDTSILGVFGLELNCVGYGTPNSGGVYPIYKPQGLIQLYSNQIKYSVLSYLDTFNQAVQGGVLREPMEFVGPTYPTPLSTAVTTNPTAEWSATTGVMKTNPDTTTASGSNVSQSGVMNYLNKFGQTGAQDYAQNWVAGSANYSNNTNIYMQYDHVSELYYAALRYFENLGNVPQWLPQSAYGASSVQLDGFPAVTTWTDPIAYSCQKNFIVGIGDDHTWTDYNVGGSTQLGQDVNGHSPAPPAVTSDTFNQANTWLNELEVLEGLPQQPYWSAGESGATLYIAGLAYGAHVLDIRPDLGGTQSISTYWMDVAEDEVLENENQYYLASKYGGFAIPASYNMTNTTPLPLSEYDTSGQNIQMRSEVLPLPNNYFDTGTASKMVASLTSAFANIAIATSGSATAFAVTTANAVTTGSYAFGSSYSSSGWTGTLIADMVSYTTGSSTPVLTQAWATDTTLQTQLAGTGWQTHRNVVTWSNGSSCGSTFTGVPFEAASLCASTQLSALASPSYSSSTTGTQYLDYLRGDTTNQVGSTATVSTQSLRARALFLGDIVDAALAPVANPAMSYGEATNPGYTAFKSTYATRPAMIYAAANDGMVHGFLGSSGTEVFAYVPNALYQGPTATPQVNGLAQLGNPNYSHHYYVDATPMTADLDLGRTGGATGTPNWATALIGGLGKGGTSFYAINVTDPATLQTSTETQIAQKVLWEYTDSTMGYSFGTPVVAKVAQYGWVVLFTSGYDNSDGYGYLYIVNPATGALLQKIKTPSASSGLTQVAAFTENYTDFTAESAYVGDLNGQVWRFDLRLASGTYPTPTLIAQLTDPSGNPQPVTSAPDIEINPVTLERYVLLGTGKLLTAGDVAASQAQTFYAIVDGNDGAFNTALTTPVTRSTMTAITNITAAATIPSTSKGWYYDLSAGYRVLSSPISYNGIVAFSALLPTGTSSDPCSPGGSSEVFAVNYGTAQSALSPTTTGGTPPAYVSFNYQIATLAFVNTGTGGSGHGSGSASGNSSSVQLIERNCPTCNANDLPFNKNSLATRPLSWREIPTPD